MKDKIITSFKSCHIFVFFFALLLLSFSTLSAQTVTAATGGTNVSLDTHSSSASASWTTLTGLVVTEASVGQFTVGNYTLILPTGWQFDITQTVTVAASAGGGTFAVSSSTYTPTASTLTIHVSAVSTVAAGTLTFGNLKVQPSGTTAPSTGDMSSTLKGSTSFGSLSTVVGAANANISTLTPTSSSIIANGSSTRVLTVTAKDQFGNNLTSGGPVGVISNLSGTGTISGTTNNGNGTYTATVTSPTSIGSGIFIATLGGNPVKSNTGSQTQATVTYIAGAATKFIVTTTGPYPAGTSITATAQLADVNNNPINTSGISVYWSKTGTGGAFTASPTSTNGSGIATATFTMANTIGTPYTITAADDPTTPVKTGTSATFTTVVGVGSAYRITAANPTPTAGSNDLLTISIVDQLQNVVAYTGTKSITFSGLAIAPDGVSIPSVADNSGLPVNFGTATTIHFTNGVSDVGGTLTAYKAEGPVTLTATDGAISTSSTGGTGVSLTVGKTAFSNAVTSVSVSQAIINVAGTSTITLQAKDSFGNNITTGGVTVGFTNTTGAGVSTGTITPTTDVGNGSYTATFTGTAAGTATTINATYNSTSITSTLPTITVTSSTAISAATSTVSVSSPTVVSGSLVTVTLQAKNAAGTNITTGGAAVLFSNIGGTSTGTFSTVIDHSDGTYTTFFTGVLAGTATTINATIGGVNVTTAMPTVTVLTSGAISPATSTVSVSAGTVVSGLSVTVTLQAKNSAGNNLTTSSGAAILFSYTGGTSTGTFSSVVDHNDGTYTATFTGVLSGTATSINATINSNAVSTTLPTVTVTPAAVAYLKATPASTTMLAGNTNEITLTARDLNGNIVTSYVGSKTITFTGLQTDGTNVETIEGATMITPLAVSFAGGVSASGAVTFQSYVARSAALNFSDGTYTTTGDASYAANITIVSSVGALQNFLVEASGGSIIGTQVAGTPINITITARDANNIILTSFTGSVTFSTNAGTITPLVSAAFVGGVLTTSVTVTQARTLATITVTKTSGSGETGTSSAFTVNAGPVVYLTAVPVNASMLVGQTDGIIITARDLNGNVATSYAGSKSITFTGLETAGGANIETIQGVQMGTPVLVNFTNGISQAGSLTFQAYVVRSAVIHFTDGTHNTWSRGIYADAANITIVSSAGALQNFLVEAAAGGDIGTQVAGSPISIKITARDVNNITLTGFTGTVNFSTNAGTITPSVSSAFANGVLTTSVTVSQIRTLATITVTKTSGAGETGTSNTFTVTAGPVSYLTATPASTTMLVGQTNEITITARDLGGNVATSYSGIKTILFTGLQSVGGNAETIEGSVTSDTVTFTGGVSRAGGLTFQAYVARNAVLNFNDGTYSTAGSSSYAANITIASLIPSAPVATAASGITDIAFNANWAVSSGATGYYLDVATDSLFTIPVSGFINKSVGNVTTYQVIGLSPNTKYYYRVRANNSNGTSPSSNVVSVTTLLLAPLAPVATAATGVTDRSFNANWNASIGATGYFLDVYKDLSFTIPVSGYIRIPVGNVTTYPVTGLTAFTIYYYRVRAYNSLGESSNSNTITTNTLVGIDKFGEEIPTTYKLLQNYPNPFNPSTLITYGLPKDGNVTIIVYNIVGSEIATLVNGYESSGYHQVTFNATNLASGMYIYKINAGGMTIAKKMLLMK